MSFFMQKRRLPVCQCTSLKKCFDFDLETGAVLFAFTCMIDLIIALEYNGFISSFMSEYLKMGEPYLHSPWGSAISLFDGIGFYFMYLAFIFQMSNGFVLNQFLTF
jgi:hypothetical protein